MTTTALTAETCFDCPAFCAWWDAAYDYIASDYEVERMLGCPDYGWALQAVLDRYQEGMTPKAAVDEIVEGWEPSDDEMMSAFGTKWHDGL
jgi:hypothetical protein